MRSGQSRAKKALPSRSITTSGFRVTRWPTTGMLRFRKATSSSSVPLGAVRLCWPRPWHASSMCPFAIADATTHRGWLRRRRRRERHQSAHRNSNGDVGACSARGSSASMRSTRSRARAAAPRSPATLVARAQQGLLKLPRGTPRLPPDGARNRPQQELIQVDTTDILFICCGAFNGLERHHSPPGRRAGTGFGAGNGQRAMKTKTPCARWRVPRI